MKKLKKSIQKGEKKLNKLSKAAYYESNILKTMANSLDAKISESKNELAEISALKETLKLKKKKIGDQKTEIKTLGKELKENSITIFREFLKRQKEERKALKIKEKNEQDTIKAVVNDPINKAVAKPVKQALKKPIKKVVKTTRKPIVKKQ